MCVNIYIHVSHVPKVLLDIHVYTNVYVETCEIGIRIEVAGKLPCAVFRAEEPPLCGFGDRVGWA